jgi:hypothetical protein
MEPEQQSERPERNGFPVAFLAGVIVVFFIFGGIVLLSRTTHPGGSAQAEKLPFGPTEQAYAKRIHFKDIQMARATNFLNQEFTYVAGTISNDGAQTIRQLEVTMEFHDPFNQVVLRETQQLIGTKTRPLAGGQMREFQIALEHVPAEWDQQYPTIRVTGLVLE